MGIKWAAILASVLAVAVLATLIVSSRSADVQDYSVHYRQLNQIDQSIAHFDNLLEQLFLAQRDGRATGPGVADVSSRLTDLSKAILLSADSDTAKTKALKKSYEAELKSVLRLSELVENQQNEIAEELTNLRQNGPQQVQNLKSSGLEAASQNLYQLLLKTITLGASQNPARLDTARALLAQTQAEEALQTGSGAGLIQAIEQVITTQALLDKNWSDLTNARFSAQAEQLRSNYNELHALKLNQAENSRILLSMFSVLLIASLAFLGFRLQNSYREINKVNERLNLANTDLEKRVQERTRELNQAFGDLKESQVQLVQTEKMASLGQLVAGISHEINTPLLYLQSNQTIIDEALSLFEDFVSDCHDKLIPSMRPSEDLKAVRRRYIQGLRELKQKLVDLELKEELREIHDLSKDNMKGLEELTIMAKGLKDFSRLDRAPVDTFNLNDGIERTLLIAKNILKHRINVIKNLQDVPDITCSPSQINQVLLNLITNAAQAIEGTGDITISTSSEDGFVHVSIEDTGCGIEPENLAKIRDPFFTTKEVGEGTGLGLSICGVILSAHNGLLEIESKPGKGSKFTVSLPRNNVPIESLDTLGEKPPAPKVATLDVPRADAVVANVQHGVVGAITQRVAET